MTFGQRLRAARIKAGLTQELLACRANMSQRNVCFLEQDKHKPRPETVIRLAVALNAKEHIFDIPEN